MDVRILLIPKQENPPTITANKASSTGKLVAHFSRTCSEVSFRLPTEGVERHTYRAPHFFMHSRCAVLLQSCCQSVAPAWLKPRSTLSAFRPKTFTPHPCRAMSYTFQKLTPRTGPPSSLFPESVFLQSEQPCGDQRPQHSGALTEIPPLTGYEPNWTAEDQDYRHFTEDKQFTELEDRAKSLSHNQSIKASTYESAESIETHPESDFDDEQIRALLASTLYLQERGASAERSQVYHSERENLMSSSSLDPTSTGKHVALFSSKNRLNQDTFSDREDFPSRHQQFFAE